MNVKTTAAAALLVAGSAGVWADNLSELVPLETSADGAWSAFATAEHGEAAAFIDHFYFAAFPHPVLADGNLSTTSLGTPASSIDFTSAVLSNGITSVNYSFEATQWSFFGITYISKTGAMDAPTVFEANLPLTLTVTGVAASGYQATMGNVAASYNTNINFTMAAVPETSTFAMLFAGLAFIGWHAKRRQR